MSYTTTNTALTTVFTPPASCVSHWTYEGRYFNSVPNGLLLQNALAEVPDEDCFPPGFEGFGRAPSYYQVYSPGTCPVGYTTAGNAYNGAATTVTCCPSNFEFLSTVGLIQNGKPSELSVFRGCISTFASDAGPTAVPGRGSYTYLPTTTVTGPITMWAQPISVAYQEADLQLYTTSQPASSTPRSSTGFTSPTPTSSTTISEAAASTSTTSTSIASDPGLSDGAIAGVAIGAVAVIAVVVTILWWLRRRKSKAIGNIPPANNTAPAYPFDAPRGALVEAPSSWLPSELENKSASTRHQSSHEMLASPIEYRHKHQGNGVAYELG